jgi:hypothetical protein
MNPKVCSTPISEAPESSRQLLSGDSFGSCMSAVGYIVCKPVTVLVRFEALTIVIVNTMCN